MSGPLIYASLLSLCLCRTRRGPGPRLYAIQVPPPIHSGPGPGPSRTWSSHFLDVVPFYPLDLVQPPCPTDTSEPHSVDLVHHTKSHRGQISATPRPKISHTSAKFPLDLVKGSMPFKYVASTLGYTQWTWSNHHALQVPQSHTQWTWSTTQNCTSARYRPHQGQNTVTPRPNTPWTWSKAFVDQVHHP